jgi:hypothetical protein
VGAGDRDQTEAVTRYVPLIAAAVVSCCWTSATASAASRTTQTWAQAANRVCVAYARRAKALGSPPVSDLDAAARWVQKALPLVDAEITALARLSRPPALAARIARWIAVMRANAEVTRKILVADRAHDNVRLGALSRQTVALYLESNRLARALGATACAGPQPS